MPPIRIVLAEDSMLLREGLTMLLREAGFEVVAAYDNADDLVTDMDTNQPDVAVLDVRLPPAFTDEGIVAATRIRRSHPSTSILILSQYVESVYAQELFAAGEGGIGYLLKDRVMSLEALSDSVNRVASGGTVLDPQVVSALLTARSDPLKNLSPRETDTLRLMAEGLSNTEIAKQTCVSVGTVEKHVSSVFTKLGLNESATQHRRVLAVLTWLRNH